MFECPKTIVGALQFGLPTDLHRLLRARLYVKQGHTALALSEYNKFNREMLEDMGTKLFAQLVCERAKLMEANGQLEEAEQEFSRCINKCPLEPEGYFRRGKMHIRYHRWELAIQDLKKYAWIQSIKRHYRLIRYY